MNHFLFNLIPFAALQQSAQTAPQKVKGVVSGQILNLIPAASAQLQGAAERPVRRGQSDEYDAHVHAALLPP